MKILCWIGLVLIIGACAAPREPAFVKHDTGEVEIQPGDVIYIKAAFDEAVPFHGQFDYDNLGAGSGNMAYPGDSAATFLTAIAVHAIAADSVNNAAKTTAQQQADLVLTPYESYLDDFLTRELVDSVVAALDDRYTFDVAMFVDDAALYGWVLRSEPEFFMSQDQSELVLRHAMYIHRVDEPDYILYKNFVEVVSRQAADSDPMGYWVADNHLALVSGELYAASIELFMDDALNRHADSGAAEQTFRYRQGGKNNYERGTLVSHKCGQTTIRTLRGWLKSFPSNDSNSVAAASAAEQKQPCSSAESAHRNPVVEAVN